MAMATSTVAPDKQLRNKTIFSTLRPNFLGILVEDCGEIGFGDTQLAPSFGILAGSCG